MSKTIKDKIDLAESEPTPSSPENNIDEKNGGKIKVMAEAGRPQPGAEVLAAANADNPVVPGNFHEFTGSQSKMYVTYANRQEKIAQQLGTKAPLVS